MKLHISKIALFSLLSLFSLTACEVAVNTNTSSNESIVSEESTNVDDTPTTFTITWKDDEGNVLKTQTDVSKGTTPSYGSSKPTKEQTIETTYTFSHWTPTVGPATQDQTYIAVFSSNPRKYNITWLDDSNNPYKVTQVDYGIVPSYEGTPTKDPTNTTSYTFSHWTPTPTEVSEDATYVASFTPSVRLYDVTWLDDDNTPLRVDHLEYGDTPSYGSTPTKSSTAQYDYTFDHWDKEIVPVTSNITYKAVYSSAIKSYTITWKDDNGATLDTSILNYGATPSYGSTPTKDPTASTVYSFDHWSPSINTVTQDATYTAVYTETPRTYNITWLDDEDNPYRVDQVAYNVTPSYGSIPSKASTDSHNYTFLHWDNTPVPVTGDATYKAVFESSIRSYTVTWKDDNGNTLATDNVNYGSTPSYLGDTPTKASTNQYTYAFSSWSPAITAVTGNVTYTASFTPTVRQYDITWLNEDNSTLRVDHVNYGDTPDYGSEPSKAGYVFTGWTPSITSVTGNATYKATFGQDTGAYNITWKNYDGSTIKTYSYNAGVTPTYVGSTPTKPDDASYSYTFSGWSPSVTAVTGATNYTAQFTPHAKGNKLPDTFYATNNRRWIDVYAYAWNSGGSNAAWPGVKMTYFRKNPEGQAVYKISGMSNYENIIINNGNDVGVKEQTVDISYSYMKESTSGNAIWVTDNKDGSGHFYVGKWNDPGTLTQKYNFASNGQNILHCFDWSIATIINNLDDIAASGFNAIQTSPIQPVKDYTDSYNDTNESWWRFYQPVGLCIANSTSNILFKTNNGADELRTLCEEAAKRGIRVVVDVIVNHLADGTGNGGLSTQVAEFNPEIYNNYTTTLHNPNGKVDEDTSKGAIGITQCDAFGKDLNTANSTVQTTTYNFLKSLIDCGVTGLRYDAAKHIETVDDAYCGSSFWENTLGAIRSYSNTTYSRNVWAYGEIISPGDGGRSYGQYLHNDLRLNAVTAEPGWYELAAYNCVTWGESHDDYMGEGHNTTDIAQNTVNGWYYDKARTSGWGEANMLYFVRPNVTGPIGTSGADPDGSWKSSTTKFANLRY